MVKQKSFTEILLLIICCIFIFFGTMNLIVPKKMTLFVMKGVNADYALLLQQFLGSSYLLLAVFTYLLKHSKGKSLYITLGSINIIAFIHLYLIFKCQYLITIPLVYFLFIILIQICLFIALNEQLKNK